MQHLRTMSIDKLSKLMQQVETALATKVAETRRMLESKLAALTGGGKSMHRGRAGAHGKVAPKYRNPDNPSETWAGRGLRPRWLVAAMKGGKKLEHFSIAALAKKATKKTRKVRAKSKAKSVRKAKAKKASKPRAIRRPRPAPAQSPAAPAPA